MAKATKFDEFRVVLSPSIGTPGAWSVLLSDCPLAALAGPKQDVELKCTADQLNRLRSRDGWPNNSELKSIGESVWSSLMGRDLKDSFFAALADSRRRRRGLRLVVCMVGEQSAGSDGSAVRLQEIPVEALYEASNSFFATNVKTPISRSLKFKPDREPARVALPLRMLVVVSTPKDMPGDAEARDEKAALQEALKEFTGPGGAVDMQFCEPPTKDELTRRLLQRFHILHFIGHGGFYPIGNDPSPRAHLCFEDPKTRESSVMDADTLDSVLLNSEVNLVVLTACSTGKATPTFQEVQRTVGPFDGVAQRLVAGASDVSAVVAMQFDLEAPAAVTFSRTFYTELLHGDRKLDEVVTLCRKALAAGNGIGHRAWVNPVVYWRCKDGEVFRIEWTKRALDAPRARELNRIEVLLTDRLEQVRWLKSKPQAEQDALAPIIAELQQQVLDLQGQRGELLGETVRLIGGRVKAGAVAACRLTLRLRTPARIDDVQLRVRYAADRLSFVEAKAGAAAAGSGPLVDASQPGELRLEVKRASQGGEWMPGEWELATLTFQLQAGITEPTLDLKVVRVEVERDGQTTHPEAMDAVLFIV